MQPSPPEFLGLSLPEQKRPDGVVLSKPPWLLDWPPQWRVLQTVVCFHDQWSEVSVDLCRFCFFFQGRPTKETQDQPRWDHSIPRAQRTSICLPHSWRRSLSPVRCWNMFTTLKVWPYKPATCECHMMSLTNECQFLVLFRRRRPTLWMCLKIVVVFHRLSFLVEFLHRAGCLTQYRSILSSPVSMKKPLGQEEWWETNGHFCGETFVFYWRLEPTYHSIGAMVFISFLFLGGNSCLHLFESEKEFPSFCKKWFLIDWHSTNTGPEMSEFTE